VASAGVPHFAQTRGCREVCWFNFVTTAIGLGISGGPPSRAQMRSPMQQKRVVIEVKDLHRIDPVPTAPLVAAVLCSHCCKLLHMHACVQNQVA
jgi:hypothetical protein